MTNLKLLELIDQTPSIGDNPTIYRLRDKLLSGAQLWPGEIEAVKSAHREATRTLKKETEPLPVDVLTKMNQWGFAKGDEKTIELSTKLLAKAGTPPSESEVRDWGWLVLHTGIK